MHLFAAAALLLILPSVAKAEVKITFVAPDKYTDANLHRAYGKSAKEPTLHELETYLARLGEAYLPADETLFIDVLDIDLAGRFEPWQFNYKDVRFMHDYTWPSIKLRYRLERAGAVVTSAEETVSDRSYLVNALFSSYLDTMPYEKIMLERWFRRRFESPRP